jgi:hypothetical protein
MSMTSIDDMFRDMADAPAQGQTGNGIKCDGDFVIEVTSTKGNKGHWGERLVVEFKIIESSVPDQVPVGVTRSWTAKWNDKQTLPDIKAFALAAAAVLLKDLSQRERDATATYLAYAAAGPVIAGNAANVAREKLGGIEGDPFAGLKARLSTKPSKTRAGFDFTKHRWAAV